LIAGAAAAVLLLTLGALFWTAPPWMLDQAARLYPGCLYRVTTREPLVALTLDDGPDPAATSLILEQLRRHAGCPDTKTSCAGSSPRGTSSGIT
jgi:hypothetical protein